MVCERLGGIAIIEVTEPSNPQLIRILTGWNVGARVPWCNVHTSEIGRDPNGDAAYLYVSSNDTNDLRVLDLHDLSQVVEVGRYVHPKAGASDDFPPRYFNFVHDTTITQDRVYVAYWDAGLLIFDRSDLEAGAGARPLNPLDSISPPGLSVHHSFPTADGQFVFVEDEVHYGQPQLFIYDIRDLTQPKQVTELALPNPLGSPHNLLVVDDLLYVGWYQDGVRVFRYTTTDPEHPAVSAYASFPVRSRRTANPLIATSEFPAQYDGIWGVRIHGCVIGDQPTTCVYASDLTNGLTILALQAEP
jgi:hypothetical protein